MLLAPEASWLCCGCSQSPELLLTLRWSRGWSWGWSPCPGSPQVPPQPPALGTRVAHQLWGCGDVAKGLGGWGPAGAWGGGNESLTSLTPLTPLTPLSSSLWLLQGRQEGLPESPRALWLLQQALGKEGGWKGAGRAVPVPCGTNPPESLFPPGMFPPKTYPAAVGARGLQAWKGVKAMLIPSSREQSANPAPCEPSPWRSPFCTFPLGKLLGISLCLAGRFPAALGAVVWPNWAGLTPGLSAVVLENSFSAWRKLPAPLSHGESKTRGLCCGYLLAAGV